MVPNQLKLRKYQEMDRSKPCARGAFNGRRTLLRMGDHRLHKGIIMLGELEKAGQRGSGGKTKEGADRVAEDHRVFGIMGD